VVVVDVEAVTKDLQQPQAVAETVVMAAAA
jgi:hypothetical protein